MGKIIFVLLLVYIIEIRVVLFVIVVFSLVKFIIFWLFIDR